MSPLRARGENGRLVPDQLSASWKADANALHTSFVANAFRTTLDLFETGLDLMRQNLRRSHPDAGDEEIEGLLHQWLLDRPGAKSGDCPGRSVDVTRFA